MKRIFFTCALLVFFTALSACGHRGGGNNGASSGVDSAGGISLDGDPMYNGSSGAIGVTTIQSQDEDINYTMVVSFGATPLGMVRSDISAYQVSNGLSF